MLGIGVNVAVRVEELPAEVSAGAASLQRPAQRNRAAARGPARRTYPSRLAQPANALLESWRARDALYGRDIAWAHPARKAPASAITDGRARASGGDRRQRGAAGAPRGWDDDGAQRRRGSLGVGRLIGPLQRFFDVLLQLLA